MPDIGASTTIMEGIMWQLWDTLASTLFLPNTYQCILISKKSCVYIFLRLDGLVSSATIEG